MATEALIKQALSRGLYAYWQERLKQTGIIEAEPLPAKLNTLVIYPGTVGGFDQLTALLPRFKDIGVNQIHLLPFYEASGDDGFEVVNYTLEKPLRVAKAWGGLAAFNRLTNKVKQLGLFLMADSVLNHISGRSPILKQIGPDKLLLGWPQNRVPFKFLGLKTGSEGGVLAVYEHGGREIEHMVIFPEQADPTRPHLTRVGHRLVWHTFYPNQLDVDLNKPEAFKLVMNTVLQIADWLRGRGTIRLDAIPYVGKIIDKDRFEFMDSRRGMELIARLRLLLAVKAPQMRFLAEAARPLNSLAEYVKLVGGNYDFLSFPRFIAAVATEDPSCLISQVNKMVEKLGLATMARLANTVQTHDDIPLAELGDPDLSRSVYRVLTRYGALPFGRLEKGGIPKGVVTRLADVCGGNADKITAAMFLAALLPHGRLLWLYGTESGLPASAENYRRDQQLAQTAGRQPDARSYIRQPVSLAEYQARLDQPLAKKVGEILKMRLNQLPDHYDSWQAKTSGSRVTIRFSGTKGGRRISGRATVNLTKPYDFVFEKKNSH